ncbi:hypothetical protein AYO44_16785 [Planctomycetaceae bacterium SCGC AG-212-F19]|nr:hypothetical protein AYO44_16785 [Planctomycetaceae bacterium SCGC AG-212-F19]
MPTDTVLRWNETTLQAIRTDRTSPPVAAKNLAMVHASIYDAVMGIYRTHASYYVPAQAEPDLRPDVAAAVAAHRTLITLYPKQVERFDSALDDSLQAAANAPTTVRSIRWGQHVAEVVLDWRSRDGTTRQSRYAASPGTGIWQPTPPDFRAALLPHWSSITCFCMRAGGQFRPAGPPSLRSEAYRAAFQDVKALGAVDSRARTPDQTEIALFWADDAGTATPPGHWNQIAQVVAHARGTTLAENARLFALLNLALADAAIVSWDCKYHYNFWRPIQAIRAGDAEGRPEGGDPNWTPLIATPPFPSYTSGHSTFSGAGAAALANFFGTDKVPFTLGSDGLPGRSRSFTSFSAAAAEAGRSRIYGGIHWAFDDADGLTTGRAAADYVFRHFLTPRAPTESSSSYNRRSAP